MKVNNTKIIFLPLLSIFLICGCHSERNFFEDADDPGLSRFTSRGYNIVTLYLNDSAFTNPYEHKLFGNVNSPIEIQKLQTNGDQDTLTISWEIKYQESPSNHFDFNKISLLFPIPKNFSQSDLLSWDGKRFPENPSLNIALTLERYSPGPGFDTGRVTIYFVKLARDERNTAETIYQLSGLFEGNAGNNKISKGRFDFSINAESLNF